MIRFIRPQRLLATALLTALSVVAAVAESQQNSPPLQYEVSLANPAAHRVHVHIKLPSGADQRDLQLPVWNALYQVRDFSQYVTWVKAKDSAGVPLSVKLVDKSLWHVAGVSQGADVEYEIIADESGAYGAQLNAAHGFFNLAEILMYPVDARSAPVQLCFRDIPAGWRIATALVPVSGTDFSAANYDDLVDAPVEVSAFQESDFDEAGAHYRVVVDADPSSYDMLKIVSTVRRIVVAATAWMNDRPFQTFLFLYHFPAASPDAGMEHMYSTAIDINARIMAQDALALPETTAHEFFHLWNVKRIRPQSLDAVDYTKENYSDALWFCEGVTNTVQDYILLRAKLLDEPHYLSRLAEHIEELELRSAHLTQSAEASSLDAWLEKYPAYRQPDRSISYYNKGELLGVMLDLAVQEKSHGSVSLRNVLQWMNQNYARQRRPYENSEGVRRAAEAVSHSDLKWFFEKYVEGTEEIPWDDFFRPVGLRLVRSAYTVADAGFVAALDAGRTPVVTWVDPDGEGQRAGLEIGDAIVEMNGQPAGVDFPSKMAALAAGAPLRLKVRNRNGEHELRWRIGRREEIEFELKDVENITPQQKARRAAWLTSEPQGD